MILGEEELPPAARRCPKPVRRLIRNCHRNLGHPSNYALVRLMTTAKCHPDMISYANHMKCPTCQIRAPPKRIPRATMPYRPTKFNAVIGIDIKWIFDSQDQKYYMLNILDLATGFNIGIALENKSGAEVTEAFKTYWLSWAGPPGKVVADQGREGYGHFTEMARELGTHFNMVPVEAPWQNGMVERHGSVLGDIITATIQNTSPTGYKQMKDVCLHASMAKNRRPGKSGYSPRTAVFGVEERLIASGLNHYLEEPDDAAIHAAATDTVYKKSMEIRKAAMCSIIELDHSEKWAAAIKYPSRAEVPQLFLPGNQVFFFKAAPGKKGGKKIKGKPNKGRSARSVPDRWYGPAVVIGNEWDQNQKKESVWIRYAGRCSLVAYEHLRHATLEEALTQEQVVQSIKDGLCQLSEERKPFTYDDNRPLLEDEEECDEDDGLATGDTETQILTGSQPDRESTDEDRTDEIPRPTETKLSTPSVPPDDYEPVSIREACGKIFGSLSKLTDWTDTQNMVRDDNMFKRESRVPPARPQITPSVPTVPKTPKIYDHVPSIPVAKDTSWMRMETGLEEMEQQTIYKISNSDNGLCVDERTKECFFVKQRPPKPPKGKNRMLNQVLRLEWKRSRKINAKVAS